MNRSPKSYQARHSAPDNTAVYLHENRYRSAATYNRAQFHKAIDRGDYGAAETFLTRHYESQAQLAYVRAGKRARSEISRWRKHPPFRR